jgi:hypothetical protein
MFGQYEELFESWVVYFDRALDLARELKDPETFWEAAGAYFFWVWSPDHAEKQLKLAEEIMRTPYLGVNIRAACYTIGYAANVFLGWAHYEKMKNALSVIRQIEEQSNQIHIKIGLINFEIVLRILDGDLLQAVEDCHKLAELAEKESVVNFVDVSMVSLLPRALAYLGMNSDVLRMARQRLLDSEMNSKILSLLNNNQIKKALELIDGLIDLRMQRGSNRDETAGWRDVFLLERCIALKHTKAIQFLYDRLKDCRHVTTACWAITCTALHLGRAAEILGHLDKARNHYENALQVATEIRYRPEIAITRYEISRLLLENYPEEKKEALAHLDFALQEFNAMKMTPFIQRATALKERVDGGK